jgi:hypothetical protein
MEAKAREHLGFPTCFDFMEWAARQVPGQFRTSQVELIASTSNALDLIDVYVTGTIPEQEDTYGFA